MTTRRRSPARNGGALLIVGLTAAGCAPVAPYQPAVDLHGADAARYAVDLRDCRRAADLDRYGPVLAGLVVGAGLGAGLGNVAGWMVSGRTGLATGYGAAAGGLVGTAVGLDASQITPSDAPVIDQCLRNNGYKIGG